MQDDQEQTQSRQGFSRRGLLTASAIAALGLTSRNLLKSTEPAQAAITWGHPFTFYSTASRGFSPDHMGIDYTAGIGTVIHAAADGVVTTSTNASDWGQYVKIDHGGGYQSLYAHMIDGSRRVVRGQQVKRGTVLGQVGSTGRSTGAHLHIEVYVGGKRVDPYPFVDANRTAPLANQVGASPDHSATYRRNNNGMASLFHIQNFDGSSTWALAGDGPGAAAWLQITDVNVANGLSAQHGPAVSLNWDTWQAWKTAYLSPQPTSTL